MNFKVIRVPKEFQRAAGYYGIYSRVARQIGVSSTFVRKVGRGLGTSKRVHLALMKEVRRIERLAKKAA